jgi:hypothetical protein
LDGRINACRNDGVVQHALGIVVFAVVALALLAAIAGFLARSRVYDEIGKGGFHHDDDRPARSPAADADEEIRQMMAARNERRARRGEAPLDVAAEVARLSADPGLEAEVRAHVIASNERRARRGQPPLDVDAEVARRLSGAGG